MVHIIGANGYIGTALCKYLDSRNVVFDCYSDIADERCKAFNLTSFNEDDLSFKKGDIVVLLAAISSPDVCQNNYDFAYSINVTGTKKFVNYCMSVGCKVIFFSSDTVNGATDGKVNDEYSEVNPFGNYAQMKYEIEKTFRDSKDFKTIRLSYVLSDHDKFFAYLKDCIDKNARAEVFDGLFRSVVRLETVLESVYCLIKNFDFNDYYLVNISGNKCISRKDLAEYYQKEIDNRLEFDIIPVPESITRGRPNIINTKSLFLEKLLGHKVEDII